MLGPFDCIFMYNNNTLPGQRDRWHEVGHEVGDEDAEDSGEEEQVEPELYGKVKELDAKFSGAIKEFMMENYKAFKNGATVGSVTPTLRLISPGSNVRLH